MLGRSRKNDYYIILCSPGCKYAYKRAAGHDLAISLHAGVIINSGANDVRCCDAAVKGVFSGASVDVYARKLQSAQFEQIANYTAATVTKVLVKQYAHYVAIQLDSFFNPSGSIRR